ncbi:MAG: hypothetical protein NC038_00400 [Paludibacter sp.]|nr:hypothetical protein [Bacteroidales bacterium]MCM1068652.1 hypothetical protein [Prevotella sp.]MCM1353316.1 hypothetical protein [Bacteroides sp.]MCM1442276.1 hypothetical protein [Muribaculum sp.]MCM1481095.1 hypothetical protein [Paludibacter sp.]
MNRKGLSILLLTFCLSGCEFIRQHQLGGAVVSVAEQSLYYADLKHLTANAVSPEDSARIADSYIQQWASDILLYHYAKQAAKDPKSLDALAEDYKRSLYIYEYEQQLVEQRMPKQISPESIQTFYATYPERFTLRENLIKGMFIVIPIAAPATDKLKVWMQTLNEDDLELIEKHAYQYANGYELFTDRWQTQHNIMLRIPAENDNFNQLLKTGNLIELRDSTNLYLLRITDKRLIGEPMPLEFATPEIEKILLNRRQVAFLKQHKDELYNKALRQGKIVFNHNNKNHNE